MPYKDKARQGLAQRGCIRTLRHGNWRQIYLDCGGMCSFVEADGSICGSPDKLEFHEDFGEAKNGENKLQHRRLVCHYHHEILHREDGDGIKCFYRPHPHRLQEDVAAEIAYSGSTEAWARKYNLNLSQEVTQ